MDDNIYELRRYFMKHVEYKYIAHLYMDDWKKIIRKFIDEHLERMSLEELKNFKKNHNK